MACGDEGEPPLVTVADAPRPSFGLLADLASAVLVADPDSPDLAAARALVGRQGDVAQPEHAGKPRGSPAALWPGEVLTRAGVTPDAVVDDLPVDGVYTGEVRPPEGNDLAAALPGADLPEIGDGDAIAALALRLDHEADFWRGVALRSLASAVWAERIAQIGSVLAGLGGLALAVLAALSALFGAADPVGRAILLGCGAVTLAAGSTLVAWISGRARQTQRDIAQAALRRADLAELRLHRVTIVLAHRQAGIDNFAVALGRLEHDVG